MKMKSLAVLASALSALTIASEVNISPVPLIVGMVDGNAMMPVSSNILVGPAMTYWGLTIDGDSLSLLGAGARAEYFFDRVETSGLFVASEGKYMRLGFDLAVSDGYNTERCTLDVSGLNVRGLVGYAWYGDMITNKLSAGYQVNTIGGGQARCTDGSSETISASDIPISGGLSLGWTMGFQF